MVTQREHTKYALQSAEALLELNEKEARQRYLWLRQRQVRTVDGSEAPGQAMLDLEQDMRLAVHHDATGSSYRLHKGAVIVPVTRGVALELIASLIEEGSQP